MNNFRHWKGVLARDQVLKILNDVIYEQPHDNLTYFYIVKFIQPIHMNYCCIGSIFWTKEIISRKIWRTKNIWILTTKMSLLLHRVTTNGIICIQRWSKMKFWLSNKKSFYNKSENKRKMSSLFSLDATKTMMSFLFGLSYNLSFALFIITFFCGRKLQGTTKVTICNIFS